MSKLSFFDQFHKNVSDIYNIYYRIITAENEIHSLSLHPHSLVTVLQNNYPAVKKATTYQRTRALVEYHNKRFIEQFAKVDSSFLSLSTLFVYNVYKPLIRPNAKPKEMIKTTKVSIVVVGILATILA